MQWLLWWLLINQSLFSAPQPDQVECQVDSDCPASYACIDSQCKDPCQLRPCHPSQTCSVENSLPIRTVVCSCPPDTFIAPDGSCKQKGKSILVLLSMYFFKEKWIVKILIFMYRSFTLLKRIDEFYYKFKSNIWGFLDFKKKINVMTSKWYLTFVFDLILKSKKLD